MKPKAKNNGNQQDVGVEIKAHSNHEN